MKRSNPIAIPTLHTFIAMYHYFDQLFWQGFFLKSYTLTQLSVSWYNSTSGKSEWSLEGKEILWFKRENCPLYTLKNFGKISIVLS